MLALVAPLVAEFVSGNLPIVFLWLLVVYVPFYGGAAVLIREVGRRSARPWVVIALLGLAYGVAEESFVSFSLFNPDYAGLRLLDFGWIPWLGTGAWWAVFVVVLHAAWSVAVPIVLVESVAGDLAGSAWLTSRGLAVPAVAVGVGAVLAVGLTLAEDDFLPSIAQLSGAAVVVAGLAGLALVSGRARPTRRMHDDRAGARPAPPPWAVGVGALVAALLFVAGAAQAGPPAVTVGGYLALLTGGTVAVVRWSRRPGWGARHRLAMATGALVPHVGFALVQAPLVEVPRWVAVVGDMVFTGALIGLLVVAWRSVPPLASRH